MVLSAAFSAVASFLVYKGDPRATQSVLSWLLGSVAGADWNKIPLPVIVVLACLVLFLLGSGWLDAMAQGPDAAASLGIPVGRCGRPCSCCWQCWWGPWSRSPAASASSAW